jgi:hypothetical protein
MISENPGKMVRGTIRTMKKKNLTLLYWPSNFSLWNLLDLTVDVYVRHWMTSTVEWFWAWFLKI